MSWKLYDLSSDLKVTNPSKMVLEASKEIVINTINHAIAGSYNKTGEEMGETLRRANILVAVDDKGIPQFACRGGRG
jgi:hypothetical protein